jgi:deoxycytidine triphosphate deaminase
MFLLNNLEIKNSVVQKNKAYLCIDNYEEKYLQHTFYYFRIGTIKSPNISSNSNKITLTPGSYILIESFEIFYLGDKIIGIIGQSTDLINDGLQLNYSPFIDPLFKGRLGFGLKNISENNIVLEIGQIIGKVTFFDIADSHPVKIDFGSMIEDKFKRKKPLRDDDPVHEDPDDDNNS